MTIKELRVKAKMTQKAFGEYFGIPRRTIQNWEEESRTAPSYLVTLMEYKLTHEGIMKKDTN